MTITTFILTKDQVDRCEAFVHSLGLTTRPHTSVNTVGFTVDGIEPNSPDEDALLALFNEMGKPGAGTPAPIRQAPACGPNPAMKIKRIILILQSHDGRHHGFRLIRCRDGRMVEAQISGGESNILTALTHNGVEFVRDYFWTTKKIREKELFTLPYAGCLPTDIRAWVAKEFRKRKPHT